MTINTKHFGEIEVEEDKIIDFGEGLPGFPDDRQFILVENEEPFWWLQSVSDGENAFILVDACRVLPFYNPEVDKSDIECLGEYSPDDFLIYNIVVLPENVKEMTVNLVAPLIINSATRRGRQVIAKNGDYGVRHYLFEKEK